MPPPKRKLTPQELAGLKLGSAAAKAAREAAAAKPPVRSAAEIAAEYLTHQPEGEPNRAEQMLAQTMGRLDEATDGIRDRLDSNPRWPIEKAGPLIEQCMKYDAKCLEMHRQLVEAGKERVRAAQAAQDAADRKAGRIKIGFLSAESEPMNVRREKAAAVFTQIIAEGSEALHAATFEKLKLLAKQGALGPEARALAQEHDQKGPDD